MTNKMNPTEISDDQLEAATGGMTVLTTNENVLTNNETVTKMCSKALDDGQPLVEVARKR